MNIGDKVRLLRGTEEGVIIRVINENTYEIEIEDGFSFPVLKSEVVLVSKTEAEHFKRDSSTQQSSSGQKSLVKETQAVAEKGIYLGFEPKGDIFTVWLINNTDYELVFKIDELVKGTTLGLHAGHLEAKSNQAIASKSSQNFDNWSDMQFSCMYFQKGIYKSKPMLSRVVSFKAAGFMHKKGTIPMTSKEGYVYQLDDSPAKINADEIKNSMLSAKAAPVPKTEQKPGSHEVDLHMEKLTGQKEEVPTSQALSYQLAVFEKELDSAIATGRDEITFIHGVGNGVLREEIHKRLSKMKNILYFQDAQKQRFGYGATLIKLKD
ncbi:MAG: Smr/MutS family protein [Imperialibacter sp.]|uniref:Smr/MutS family protein n=1 Tax=Imperialibacter sp. TaxID=2038411 RepID=UPI0032EC5549